MASKLQPHFEAVSQMRKRHMDFSQIANHLTAQGLPTRRQTLIKFYRRAVKKAVEIKKELADLEQLLDAIKAEKVATSEKQPLTKSNNPADYLPTIEPSSDPWKPAIIRPPKIKREPDKPKPKNKWDDFKIGPDVLQ